MRQPAPSHCQGFPQFEEVAGPHEPIAAAESASGRAPGLCSPPIREAGRALKKKQQEMNRVGSW